MNAPKTIDAILKTNPQRVNLVDVGAYAGSFMVEIRPMFGSIPIVSLGIEPHMVSPHIVSLYNYFENCAIDDVSAPEYKLFNVNSDSSCSSLLEMNTHMLTNNMSEKDKKWYVNRKIDNIVEKKSVMVRSLSSIFDTIPEFSDNIIHFVKIDAQGVDIRVVRSMKKYLEKTMFVCIETVTSADKNVVLYDGQITMDDDIKEMKGFGFSPFEVIDYSYTGTPEADMIFVNESLIRQ
jgi:FkbM family methyltransferase